MPLSPYCRIFDDPASPGQVILFSTRTAAIAGIERDVLRDIERNTLSGDEARSLADLGFVVPSVEEEKGEMAAYIDRMNELSRSLKPIVVMNLDCNLACSYCFEGTRKGKFFLSEETATGLTRFFGERLAGKTEINPTFYGGEPLLSADMIVRISERMRAHAEARGVAYGFSLITNGTLLTRRTVERLKPLGLRSASVTLDGPKDVHDRARPFKSGAGSFETILGNLRDVSGLIDVHVGGNFTRANYREFPGLLDVLIASGLGPDRIASVRFDPVFNEDREFSPDFHGGCTSVNEPWLAGAGAFLRGEVLSRGYRTEEVRPSVCMIERHDHLVVNWDGSLYKCPGLIGRTELSAGTVRTGLADYAVTHDLGRWKNEECLGCSYLPLCFGGCRYLGLLREGSLRGQDCRKDYFDRALNGLVLQDLRYVHLFRG